MSTIAILTIGIWKLLGKISGRVALLACAAVAILFGAANIVDAMNAGAAAN